MNDKLTMKVVGLLLGVILVSGVLVPIILDAQDGQIEKYNNVFPIYSAVANEAIIIDYTYDPTTTDMTYKVNSESYPIIMGSNATIIASSTFLLKYVKTTYTTSNYLVYQDGDTGYRYDNLKQIHVEINNGVATFTGIGASDQTISAEISYDWAFYNAEDGEYRSIWVGEGQTVYVNSLNQVYGANWVSTMGCFFSFNGTEAIVGTGAETVEYNTTNLAGVTNVLSFSVDTGVTIDADNEGEIYTIHPYLFIVPYEVIGDKTGFSGPIMSLFGIIPILVVIGLLISAMAMIRVRD